MNCKKKLGNENDSSDVLYDIECCDADDEQQGNIFPSSYSEKSDEFDNIV